jgi:hypothetical protein
VAQTNKSLWLPIPSAIPKKPVEDAQQYISKKNHDEFFLSLLMSVIPIYLHSSFASQGKPGRDHIMCLTENA